MTRPSRLVLHTADQLRLLLVGILAFSGLLSYVLFLQLFPELSGSRWIFAIGALFGAPVLALVLSNWVLGVYLLAAFLPFEKLLTFGPFASGIKALAALVFLALGLGLLRDRRLMGEFWNLLRHPLVVVVLAFSSWVVASTLWAASREVALIKVGTVLGLVGLMLAVGLLKEKQLTLWWAILALSVALSVPAGYVLPGSDGAFTFSGRFAAGGQNPNDYAGLLVIVFFVVYFGLPKHFKMARYSLAFLAPLGVFISQSRTGLLALAITPLLLLAVPSVTLRSMKTVLLAYSLVASTFLGLLYVVPSLGEDVSERYATISRYQEEETWTGRQDLWQSAVEITSTHPLLGVGAGNFAYVAPAYSAYAAELDSRRSGSAVAHNMFLSVASELGLVGLALFLAVLFFAFKHILILARRTSDLGVGLLFGLVVFVIMGLTLTWEYEKLTYTLLGSILSLQLWGRSHTTARKTNEQKYSW